jgi:electron transport complex protein RnfG
MSGFSGEVRIMCGFEADGTIRNYEVLSHAETPGLGSKMATWFCDSTGSRSVIGKNAETASLYVTKDADKNGEIEAITAATISSRAFLEAMRNAYEAFKQYGQTLKN